MVFPYEPGPETPILPVTRDYQGAIKTVTRFLPWFTNGKAKTEYHALYNVDQSTDAKHRAFAAGVEKAMRAL